MGIKDLYRDKAVGDSSLSLSRSVAIATFLVLSGGFMLNAWRKTVAYEVYIAFPLGETIAFLPQLFLRLMNGIKDIIAAWKGGAAQ